MKSRNLFVVLLLMVGIQTAFAQNFKVYLSSKQVVEYSIEQVDSIVFVEGTADIPDAHEYVDLGLPSGILWATCNVGAMSPERSGYYFAWGETQPKEDYTWSTYKYKVGYKWWELEPMDDAATANWGSDWQMPSYEQWAELINSNYVTTTWTTLNGAKGMKIVSKQNGNSLFLPAVGSREETAYNGWGSGGAYWSRSLHASNSDYAYYLFFNSSGYIKASYNGFRCYGRSVRPVRVQK